MSLRMVIPVVLTQDVRHLILKVLCGDQWIQELPATLDHGVDFTTATTEVSVVVERLPEIVDRLATGFSAGIDEDTNLRLGKERDERSVSSTASIPGYLPQASYQWR